LIGDESKRRLNFTPLPPHFPPGGSADQTFGQCVRGARCTCISGTHARQPAARSAATDNVRKLPQPAQPNEVKLPTTQSNCRTDIESDLWVLASNTIDVKKLFLRFFILVTFLRFFAVFFIFQTLFIFRKRWQSSELQAD